MSVDIFDPETVTVMAKYKLVFNPMDMGGSLRAIQDCILDIVQAGIEKAKGEKGEAVKVANHPYDVKASKDKNAANIADTLVKEFLAKCDIAVEKNANVAWHLKETSDAITGWLTEEVQYRRVKAAPTKAPTSGSHLDTLYDDRKVLVMAVRGILMGMPNLAKALVMEKGEVKLPNLQGAGGSKKDAPTGRYAKWQNKSVKWVIEGTEYPGDTHWSDLLRLIWSGSERVGKKASDLFGPIDAARKKAKKDTNPVTVKVNGKEVTYSHIVTE